MTQEERWPYVEALEKRIEELERLLKEALPFINNGYYCIGKNEMSCFVECNGCFLAGEIINALQIEARKEMEREG